MQYSRLQEMAEGSKWRFAVCGAIVCYFNTKWITSFALVSQMQWANWVNLLW